MQARSVSEVLADINSSEYVPTSLIEELVDASARDRVVISSSDFADPERYSHYHLILDTLALRALDEEDEELMLKVIFATGIPLGDHSITLSDKWDEYNSWYMKAFVLRYPLLRFGDKSLSEKDKVDILTYIREDIGEDTPKKLIPSIGNMVTSRRSREYGRMLRGLEFFLNHTTINFTDLYNNSKGRIRELLTSIILNQV